MLFKYPSVEQPTTFFGFVFGPVRWESLNGREKYEQTTGRFIHNEGPKDGYAIAHVQKMSRFGFLWNKPFCLHAWLFIQGQKKCPHGQWVPDSEFGKYIRFGLWRYDRAGTPDENGILRHWIGPWTIYLNFSFHWD